ncbi:BTB/POZ domain-containing protein At4g08455-like isoform X1 [Zingiber officinale]|uniref:BTB/POZ domain-containing protein At4g08455-like n=1 Tax=Zingiber officinale TaxID=94328 RepID=UPI001C4D4E27|nr:BTB/POZ domain-containing protein At4g08455-like [Zingiber officinale]XP_042464865.1 BTB/POZ domain-containing protein At4g08455-like isoform X1 [Zingiber officinale]
MWCQSCREAYEERDAGTCKECYEEASETEEELKREIDDLKSKVAFLRLASPLDDLASTTDLLLHAVLSPSGSNSATCATPAIPAHRAILISRSPVFKAMLENEMEESRSGIIKIHDVSYYVLRSFVHYLYTAEVLLDEHMACELLILAEKYQVKHLKIFCEKFMTSKVNNDNAIGNYAFAHRHSAKQLLEAALSLIIENMATLTEREEYKELVEKDPRLVVEIYEAYLTRQVNTAAKDSTT